jgi:rRNA maturation endonuclease Nob1
LTDTSQTALGKERCEYNPDEDLGSRFGLSRLELTLNYLDSFARMVLSMLTEDADLEDTEKPYGVIHLTHNMIGGPSIKFDLKCGNCRQVYKVTAITAIQCPTCGAVNHF